MKCKECSNPAIYFRKYEGRALCAKHFCESIERKFKRTVGKNQMVSKGDKIIVGLSGGKNSAVLLYLLKKTFGQWPKTKIIAATADEGISGYTKYCIENSKRLCKKLGVQHKTLSFKKEFGKTFGQKAKQIKDPKMSPATYIAVGRRYVLNKFSRKTGAAKLATGHSLDSECQSIIMNYIRGDLSRAARLGPTTDWSIGKTKQKLFVPRIKPLREIPEKEIAIYALVKGLPVSWLPSPYPDTMRSDVQGFVYGLEAAYPGIRYTILETFDKLLPAFRAKVEQTEGKIFKCKKCGEPASEKICMACKLWR